MFELHPQLEKDSVLIGDLPLCKVLLSRDSLYPWLILVPRRQDIREIFQLSAEDQSTLLTESSAVGAAIAAFFKADKLNVAALGNMVPQLHIHHIVRFESDPAWPNPVWGAVPAVPYSDEELCRRVEQVRSLFSEFGLQIAG